MSWKIHSLIWQNWKHCMYLFIVTEANCKETLVQAFSCEFSEISKNTFSTEHLRTTASVAICFYYIFVYLKRQKYSFADVLQNRCFWKFRKFHRRALVLESLFTTLLKRDSNTDVFLWNLWNFKNTFFIEHLRFRTFFPQYRPKNLHRSMIVQDV